MLGGAVESVILRLTGDKTEKNALESAADAQFHEPSPQEIDTLLNHLEAGRFQPAEALARAITASAPQYGRGWKALGVALLCQGRAADALAPMQRSVELSPNDSEAHKNLGNTFQQLDRLTDAEASYRQALRIEPEYAEVHCNLGNVLKEQGRNAEAEASYRRSIAINPEIAESNSNLGNMLKEQGRFAEAESSYLAALRMAPDRADTVNNLGIVLKEQCRFAEAAARFERTLELAPDFAEAHNNLGSTLGEQGRFVEAERCYRTALRLKPDYAGAYNNLSVTLKVQGRLAEAETSARQALALKPDYASAYHSLGITLADQGRLDEAEASLREALRLSPDFANARGNLLFTLNYHPDRSAKDIFRDYQAFDASIGLPLRSSWRAHTNVRDPARRLRVGYVSPDFRRHSVQSFLEPLLANHDKKQVEVYAYAALLEEDEVTAIYKQHADHWIRTNGMPDAAIAQRVRDDGIDILVDLAGHTGGNLLPVFAMKPAPVSLSWLGYGYTTGVSAIDYYLTDAACAPPGSEHLFAEQPWRLATPSTIYRPSAGMGEVGPLPALAKGYITFGTLTRSIRINHRTIRVWAELLKSVPRSRLVVDSRSYNFPDVRQQLESRFAEQGIPRERLEIGYHTPPWDVLRGIDIGLDCFPHNSGTTLFESAYMGVPFITLAGRPSVGRLGSCILHSIQRTEWIAANETEYVAKAAALAADLDGLARIRMGLRGEMDRSALLDEPAFAHKVETAYREMFRIWCGKQT
jgi:predicted O-linked N-acetylglucosamine transferase (SPINDLY family)